MIFNRPLCHHKQGAKPRVATLKHVLTKN